MLIRDRVPDQNSIDQMVDLSRRILKREWDVTKFGMFRKPIAWIKRQFASD